MVNKFRAANLSGKAWESGSEHTAGAHQYNLFGMHEQVLVYKCL